MHNQKIQFNINQKEIGCEFDDRGVSELIIQSASKNYTVVFNTDQDVFSVVNSLALKKNTVFVIDKNIFNQSAFDFLNYTGKIYVLDSCEHKKNITEVLKVVEFFNQNNISKSDQVIVIGGGVTQEIGAFACGIYKRGIPWIYFPTTLVSMCDSCLGGKANLNYQDAKNQLGLFSAPNRIYINICFLKTLEQNHIYSGLGEILKTCVIGGEYFLRLYQDNVHQGVVRCFENYQILIYASLLIKKTIIESDEFEKDTRRVLNYGHTFGHAIEGVLDFKIPHGIAVVAGMLIANEISAEEGFLNQPYFKLLKKLCDDLLPQAYINSIQDITHQEMHPFILKDKKSIDKKVMMVKVNQPGDTFITSLNTKKYFSDNDKFLFRREGVGVE